MPGPSGHRDPKLYQECLPEADQRFQSGAIKTCPRGYCTAKAKYEVYPSAYANGYASAVCQGKKPDFLKVTKPNQKYLDRINQLESGEVKQTTNMGRWFKENWVNVCEPKVNGHYQACGRRKGKLKKEDYPYCRPEIRIDNNTPMTVGEIIKKHGEAGLKKLCREKRSQAQGVQGRPTYLRTTTTQRRSPGRKGSPQKKGSNQPDPETRFQRACRGYKQSQGGLNIAEFRKETLKRLQGKQKKTYQDMLPTMTQNDLLQLVKKIGLGKQYGGEDKLTEPDMDLVKKYNILSKCQTKDGLYQVNLTDQGKKKLKVTVRDRDGKKRQVSFGHRDYQDYTRHRDEKRRDNYCSRSGGISCSKNPDGICDQTSPNFWSRTALWHCPMDGYDEICQSVTDPDCRKDLDCR